MTPATGPDESTTYPPDEAFSALGDETRVQILRALGEATEPLAFSELFDRVAYDDSSNFGYHLEKLVGHFVRKTDDGYRLQRAGRRVVEAVRSGAVTEDPVIEPTRIDERCPFCSAPIEVGVRQERVEMFCTECPGLFGSPDSGEERSVPDGSLGHMSLPPAGVRGRSPAEVLTAAWTWKHLDVLADSSGICSRCSAPVDHGVTVCEDHDADGDDCEGCGRRYAARFRIHCGNCNYDVGSIVPGCILADTAVLAFLTDHGINPVAPDSLARALAVVANYDEDVRSSDPFRAEYTFTADDEALTVAVDENCSVVDARRRHVS